MLLKERIAHLSQQKTLTEDDKCYVRDLLKAIDQGKLRLVSQVEGQWHVDETIKQILLLSFLFDNTRLDQHSWDKVCLKFTDWHDEDFVAARIRVVPGAVVRHSAYIAPRCVIAPSFVNIGAYIDEGALIDSGATIGSCAYIGKHCHISSNVVIAGVIEPPQARPVIIEDDCFIGAGCVIAESIIIRRGSVIASGVHITSSTKIIDRTTGATYIGEVPEYSVVVSGSYKVDDRLSINCPVIVKQVDAQTRSKVQLNELLRF